ncbi:MAG: helix-hairpin-helix domain-containing protein [Prevotella sp.]|jgi:DNA uptake protein ComE-like DNA-binding protein|nr:helix-hairpin-helix domain-containing protein [Prevotella sp.]
MNWKDYLYIQKGDKIAIILLLILIVLAGGVYSLTSTRNVSRSEDVGSDSAFQTFLAGLKDKDSIEAFTNNAKTYKDKLNRSYPKYIPQVKFKAGETVELNSSDTTALKMIPGIGIGYANRIVKYRNLLGGYAHITQLKEVWGMDDDLYSKVIPYLTITPKVRKVKINSLTLEELNKHPYISYKQAKVIVDIRERKGNIESLNRLSLLDEFTDNDIKRLMPYLSFE